MSGITRKVDYAGSRAHTVHRVGYHGDQVKRLPVAHSTTGDEPSSTVEAPASTVEFPASLSPANRLRILLATTEVSGRERRPSLSLPVYALTGGSLAVLVSAFAAFVVPDSWSIPVWISLAFVLCTAVGLSADRFVD